MSVVFNNPYTDSKMWSLQGGLIMLTSDAGQVTSADATNMLAATEAITISQRRAVDTRTPLVGNTSVKIVSPPTGTCQLTTIIGPHHVVENFLKIFGDACNTFTATIKTNSRSQNSCEGSGAGQTLILRGCTGAQTQFTMSVQNGMAIASGTFVFAFDTLDWSTSGKK